MRIGWGAMLAFVTMGMALELMHAYKVSFYLDVDQETRRFLWTLAHAHGIGLSLLNVVFAATLHAVLRSVSRALQLASLLCGWSTLLIPLGFFLGGIVTYGGDPGVGVFLVPAGAGMLWIAVLIIAREVWLALRARG